MEGVIGLVLLSNRFVPLALVLEMPTSFTVFYLNTFITAAPRQLITGPLELGVNCLLLLAYFRYYSPFWSPAPMPLRRGFWRSARSMPPRAWVRADRRGTAQIRTTLHGKNAHAAAYRNSRHRQSGWRGGNARSGAIGRRSAVEHLPEMAAGCFALVFAVDGLANQSLGIALPALIADWGGARAAFAPVAASNLAGVALGSILGGLIGDRIGRRWALISAIFLFGLMTAAAALRTALPN
jgi:hypothetical protein